MTNRIIRAQDILKEKGYAAPKFDTMAFQNAVVEFFRKNSIEAKLAIIPVRFVDYEDTPDSCFYACTEIRAVKTKYYEGFDSYPMPDFMIKIIQENDDIHNLPFFTAPYIMVDEPYASNAVALLKMCDFIVSRKHRLFNSKPFKGYTVTIV